MKKSSKVSNRIHFIGIGGIGVSALAKYCLEKGWEVSGSDLVSSEITEALKNKGAKIFIGPHKAKHLTPGVKQVICSQAIPKNNPELLKAKKLGIKCRNYPQALGELTKKYFTIAVSGTHGKSTTTAMIGLLLIKAGLDPTVIVGTKLKEFADSNCRVGKSRYLVIEADENFASFLNYWPKIIVLTNIEKEHLDFYKNLKNILRTYKEYIGHLPKDGILVTNKDDKNIKEIINPQKAKSSLLHSNILFAKNLKTYSLKQRESKKLRKVLKIPGEHNVYNALAALTVARVLKIPDRISFKVLSEYGGSWRRFEEVPGLLKRTIVRIRGIEKKLIKFKIISDYAHHPTEIKVTLKAAREKYPKKAIWCIFQPHQYQRTYYLFNDFVRVFKEAPIERLIITDIYEVAGREKKKIKRIISSKKLVESIKNSKSIPLHSNRLLAKNVVYLPNFQKINDYLRKNLKGGEVVIIMGAGDIYRLSKQF